jgi:hypothetical protein
VRLGLRPYPTRDTLGGTRVHPCLRPYPTRGTLGDLACASAYGQGLTRGADVRLLHAQPLNPPMEDRVPVFGRSEVVIRKTPLCCRKASGSVVTLVHIPGTDWFMRDDQYTPCEMCVHRGTHRCFDLQRDVKDWQYCDDGSGGGELRWEGVVMASMRIERSRLLAMIERCAERELSVARERYRAVRRELEDWKVHLVMEKELLVRKNTAAKKIQEAFREAASNPAFAICRRRLLREFAQLCRR